MVLLGIDTVLLLSALSYWFRNGNFHLSIALTGSGIIWGVRKVLFEEKKHKKEAEEEPDGGSWLCLDNLTPNPLSRGFVFQRLSQETSWGCQT